MVMCTECGQVFSSGYTLAPGTSFKGSGNRTGCRRCGALVEIPDGEYGVVDGAVRWLRQFHTPEQRAHLAEVLQEAGQRLAQGEAPTTVAAEIERSTGLRVWDFLTSNKGAALGTWIATVLTLLALLKPDAPAPPPATPEVHVTVVIPDESPSTQSTCQTDGRGRQDQHEDGVAPPVLGHVNEQNDGPAAGDKRKG